MCWLCDHPGATFDDYLDQVERIVARDCFAVQAVSGERRRAGFSYTVGLTEHDRPELLVTGLSRRRAHDLLCALAHHLLHAPAPPTGVPWPLRDGPVVEFVRMDVPDAHLGVAVALCGPTAVEALQVVWRDDHGRWPWDLGHRAGRGGQPVLGVRDGT
jgi:hypothetical protein